MNVIIINQLTTHVLFSEHAFLDGPLEASDDRVLDFVQVLDTLGNVNNDVGASAVWTEAPDLTGFSDILKNGQTVSKAHQSNFLSNNLPNRIFRPMYEREP